MRKAIKRILHAQWPLFFGEPLFILPYQPTRLADGLGFGSHPTISRQSNDCSVKIDSPRGALLTEFSSPSWFPRIRVERGFRLLRGSLYSEKHKEVIRDP